MNRAAGRDRPDGLLEAVQRLVATAEEAGLGMAHLALAWTLRQENVASVIIGASRPEQVSANAEAAGVELAGDTLNAIDEALGDVVISGPRLAPFVTEGVKHR